MAHLKAIVGLGNPGPEYGSTRHNVGWWLLDRLADAWGLGRFRGDGKAAVASGRAEDLPVRLIKPLTYMNRSGSAVAPLLRINGFNVAEDLLVVVDDVALEPGRARFRAEGSAGGHNGLKSVEAALATRAYPRLRIGVGACPPAMDLADWVLARPPREERQAILDLFPDLVEGVGIWMRDGIEAAMNRCNR
jgi:PTH1 family peptidyl-tRNA hydrolase